MQEQRPYLGRFTSAGSGHLKTNHSAIVRQGADGAMKRVTAVSLDQSRPTFAPVQRDGIVPEIPPDRGWQAGGLPRSRHFDD
jgi:hypothetical protein